ncbi:hypothetical protein DTO166G4_8360 [Paecilomyces variotii]|nr:hypothetical protein DTO166G4_8360 [Paecilomyces variotii]KAJ9229246.1 hypothetical protein DTO166G5_7991 [Paecilomyces variotii]KAJ9247514.1 hypothetical protein DTO195F2_9122 [Paecilomyces variotii]KAJ9295394.1 hypothetical protein DTO217A2_9058 [Paecilomyces variotii]KAJ9364909.1 hypothetical protein DTO280E4_1204 [Paecilomyces variotii]
MDHDTQPPQTEDPRSRSRSPTSHKSQYRHRSPDTRRDDTEENAARRDREDRFLEEKALELAEDAVCLSKLAVLQAKEKGAYHEWQMLKAEQDRRSAEHRRRVAEQELQMLRAELERRRARREQNS